MFVTGSVSFSDETSAKTPPPRKKIHFRGCLIKRQGSSPGNPTCDLDVHGSLIVSSHILSLHFDLVNAWIFITVLDGFISHSQVLVNCPYPITKIHLILGAAGVTLLKKDNVQQTETE